MIQSLTIGEALLIFRALVGAIFALCFGDLMNEVFRNEGLLFQEEKFQQIKDQPEWTADRADVVRIMLEELLEKREPEIETGLNELATQFYWVSPVLRALGLTYSVAEISPDDNARPDFTLFYEPDDFRTAVQVRGDRGYFSSAIAVVRAYAWATDMSELDKTQGPGSPAFDVDKLIRSTGVAWGIVTNGREWRLYHRETSGLFSTFYEVDLLSTLQNPTIEDFKYFWTIFSPEGLGGLSAGDQPLVRRMLN